MRLIVLTFTLLLVGCSTVRRPIFLCPEACKPSSGEWTRLRDCLFKENGAYWVTDSEGRYIESYRYRHDYIPLIESQFMSQTVTKEKPEHISTPLLLKHKTGTIHLFRAGTEEAIALGNAKLERHGKFDVIYVK